MALATLIRSVRPQKEKKGPIRTMSINAVIRADKRTKNLIKRIRKGEIALIDHENIDRVSAEGLIDKQVAAVINVKRSSTGSYPNTGPHLLLEKGIVLIDNVGPEVFEQVKEGENVQISGREVYQNGNRLAVGEVISLESSLGTMEAAKEHLEVLIENFAINTIGYIKKEKGILFDEGELPTTSVDFQNRAVLVVVRGYHYKEDLNILKPFIYDRKPILIGVDGGADALIEEGLKPQIIIGDMDSVSDKALQSGAELIVHAYADGSAPGLERLSKLGLKALIFKAPGTSEDIAMLLAFEKAAEMIVAVGTHLNVTEFLDKGRQGMASTFLVRLKVGTKLVDAKGVNLLYQKKVKSSQLVLLILAALAPLTAVIFLSPYAAEIIFLLTTKLRLILGI